MLFLSISHLLLALGAASSVLADNAWIVPGAVWKDTKGNKIDAHGGGIVKRGDTFYWVGQSASNNETPFMYSSTDLLNWTPLGAQASINSMWRPKIAKPNGSFWIYGQVDRNVQALKSANQVGGYTTAGTKQTIPPNSYTYSDTGMFQDDDGTWYLLTSADHNTLQINKINSDGTVGAKASQLTGGAYEAPALFKAGSTYFLIVSGKTGWRANPNKVFTSSSINGPWAGGADITDPAQKTYGSQSTFALTIAGSKQTTYIFMGDAWDSKGGPSSNYMWAPMAVDPGKKTATLQYHAMWKVDVNTGEVSVSTNKKRYEAEHATISGRAAVTKCNDCMSKRAVSKIDNKSEVVFTNVTGTGAPQWVSFLYTVNNPESGEAYVYVNDQRTPTIISDLNSRAGHHHTIPIELTLKPGDVNTIKFGAFGYSDFEMHLDGIEVHQDESSEL